MQVGVAVLWGLLLAFSNSQVVPGTRAAQTGQIVGRVTVDGTNTPVTGARIMLWPTNRPTGPMGMPPQALTDQDGRFVFDRLTPGSYRLDVHKTGFAPIVEPGHSTAQVTAGQITEMALHLQKGAAITGRVLDASGEPVTDARVMAMHRIDRGRAPVASFRLFPAPGGGQQTNDLGEFRIAGLAPGESYVAALPRGGMGFGGPGVPPTANGTADTTTYYPGTTDQAAAHTVRVSAGETVNDIVFSMQSVPSFLISGRVVDETGAPVAGAMVLLMGDPRTNNAFMGPSGRAHTGDDGRFTISEVPSGTYRLSATVPIMVNGSVGAVGSGAIGSFSTVSTWSSGAAAPSALTAMDQATEVIVSGANVSGVRVTARRPTPQ